MKKFYFSLVVAFMAMTTMASAQFVQSVTTTQSKSTSGNIFSSMTTDDYNRIYVGYNPTNIKWSEAQSEMEDSFPLKHGITVGYLRGSNIVKNLPLYIEWGANFQYLFGKYHDSSDFGEETININAFSLNIPINLAFRFSFKNNDLSITPYLGPNFRINLAGKFKLKWEDSYGDYSEEEKYNLFSKDEDDGFGDSAWKRFQVGFNFGINLSYKALNVGVGYVTDFSKIADYDEDEDCDGKLGVTTISLGVNF
jgi:opacity protein-like surface antigen